MLVLPCKTILSRNNLRSLEAIMYHLVRDSTVLWARLVLPSKRSWCQPICDCQNRQTAFLLKVKNHLFTHSNLIGIAEQCSYFLESGSETNPKCLFNLCNHVSWQLSTIKNIPNTIFNINLFCFQWRWEHIFIYHSPLYIHLSSNISRKVWGQYNNIHHSVRS